MNEPAPTPRAVTLLVAGFEAGLVVVAIVLGWLFGVSVLETLTWDRAALGWGLLATVPLLVGLLLAVWFPVWPFCDLLEAVDHFLGEVLHGAKLKEFALISLMAGIGEEMLFRGLVQTLAERWTGSWPLGLIVASILFGLAHSVTVAYALLAGVVGAYFGLLWLYTDNLLAPIAAHAAYDFFAIWYLTTTVHRRRFTQPVPGHSDVENEADHAD